MPSSQQQEARSNHSVPVNKCSAGSGPEVLPLPQPAWSLSWGWGVRSEVSCELLYFRSGWACRRTFQTHSLTLQAASGSKPPHTHIFLMFVGEFRSNTRRSYSFHTEHIPCRFPGFHIPVQSLGVRGGWHWHIWPVRMFGQTFNEIPGSKNGFEGGGRYLKFPVNAPTVWFVLDFQLWALVCLQTAAPAGLNKRPDNSPPTLTPADTEQS